MDQKTFYDKEFKKLAQKWKTCIAKEIEIRPKLKNKNNTYKLNIPRKS